MGICIELFISFWQIGLLSIGGGYATIPLIQYQVVVQRGWLSMQEFTDIITISQMTPGPLAVNTSTFTGIRIAGTLGAVIATVGCIISGYLISIGLYRFFGKYRSSQYVAGVLSGLKSASAGLIISAAATILVMALAGDGGSFLNIKAACMFAAALLILRKFKLNPILVMVITGAVGAVVYW